MNIDERNKYEEELKAQCIVARYWERWVAKIPRISFPTEWLIKITPPTGGALIRFRVSLPSDPENDISVYLDAEGRLGGSENHPYWELYPDIDGDTYRCGMNETKELLDRIQLNFDKRK
jgi:hypothetical protein